MNAFNVNRFIAAAIFTFGIAIVAAGQPTCPQSERKLFGWVRDFQTQRPLRNAAITVEVAADKQNLKSDADGHYGICLSPGTYRMLIEKKSYARYLVTEIQITGDEDKRVDVNLERPRRTSYGLAPPNKSLDRSGGSVFCIIIGPAKVE